MLLRLAYLGVTNALAMLRLLPMCERTKDAEILALRRPPAPNHGRVVRRPVLGGLINEYNRAA